MGISIYPWDTTPHPKIPGMAEIVQEAQQNTWYTLLNITSGKGILTNVAMTNNDSIPVSNYNIKITIDGTATEINPSLSSQFSLSDQPDSSSQYRIHFNCHIYFYNSCKIEILNEYVSTTSVTASTFYSLE